MACLFSTVSMREPESSGQHLNLIVTIGDSAPQERGHLAVTSTREGGGSTGKPGSVPEAFGAVGGKGSGSGSGSGAPSGLGNGSGSVPGSMP